MVTLKKTQFNLLITDLGKHAIMQIIIIIEQLSERRGSLMYKWHSEFVQSLFLSNNMWEEIAKQLSVSPYVASLDRI